MEAIEAMKRSAMAPTHLRFWLRGYCSTASEGQSERSLFSQAGSSRYSALRRRARQRRNEGLCAFVTASSSRGFIAGRESRHGTGGEARGTFFFYMGAAGAPSGGGCGCTYSRRCCWRCWRLAMQNHRKARARRTTIINDVHHSRRCSSCCYSFVAGAPDSTWNEEQPTRHYSSC